MALAEDLAEVRQALAIAKKLVVQAEARLRLLLAGSRAENVEAAAAEIAQFEAQRKYIKEQLLLAMVVSPVAGIVTTRKPEVFSACTILRNSRIRTVPSGSVA